MVLYRNIAAAAAVALTFACNTGEFAGASAKKQEAAQKKEEKPKKGKKEDPETDKPIDEPSDEQTTGDPDPVDNTADANPQVDNTTDNANGQDNSLVDLLQGLLTTNDDVVVNQPNDNEIIFGGDKVFHIGDIGMSNSSCLFEMTPYGVTGKKYYFEFEVIKDTTTININIQKVCGVDYTDTNFVKIMDGAGAEVKSQQIPKDTATITLPAVTLNKGRYSVVVESKSGTADPQGNPADFDNFIVGRVELKASGGPVRPGKVGAN